MNKIDGSPYVWSPKYSRNSISFLYGTSIYDLDPRSLWSEVLYRAITEARKKKSSFKKTSPLLGEVLNESYNLLYRNGNKILYNLVRRGNEKKGRAKRREFYTRQDLVRFLWDNNPLATKLLKNILPERDYNRLRDLSYGVAKRNDSVGKKIVRMNKSEYIGAGYSIPNSDRNSPTAGAFRIKNPERFAQKALFDLDEITFGVGGVNNASDKVLRQKLQIESTDYEPEHTIPYDLLAMRIILDATDYRKVKGRSPHIFGDREKLFEVLSLGEYGKQRTWSNNTQDISFIPVDAHVNKRSVFAPVRKYLATTGDFQFKVDEFSIWDAIAEQTFHFLGIVDGSKSPETRLCYEEGREEDGKKFLGDIKPVMNLINQVTQYINIER